MSAGVAFGHLFADTVFGTLANFGQGFIGFWKQFVFKDTWMGWLVVAAWSWTLIRSIKNSYFRVMLVIFILFFPAMCYLGLTRFRLGQAGPFLFASFVPVGILMFDLSKELARLFGFRVLLHGLSTELSRLIGRGNLANDSGNELVRRLVHRQDKMKHLTGLSAGLIICIMAIVVSIYQVSYADFSSWQWLRYTYTARTLKGEETAWSLRGKASRRLQRTADLLAKRAKDGVTINAGFGNTRSLDFVTNYKYNVRPFQMGLITDIYALKDNFREKLPQGSINGRLLFLWPERWVDRLNYFNSSGELRLRYIDEGGFSSDFEKPYPVFVVLDRYFRFIGRYLKKIPTARKISTSSLIFKVTDFKLRKKYKPHVAVEIGELLAELRDKNPENYRVLRNEFFPRYFGFRPKQVDGLADLDEDAAKVIFINNPVRKKK